MLEEILNQALSAFDSKYGLDFPFSIKQKVKQGDLFIKDNYLILLASIVHESDSELYWKLQLNLDELTLDFEQERHTPNDDDKEKASHQIKPPFVHVTNIKSVQFHMVDSETYVANIAKFINLLKWLPTYFVKVDKLSTEDAEEKSWNIISDVSLKLADGIIEVVDSIPDIEDYYDGSY